MASDNQSIDLVKEMDRLNIQVFQACGQVKLINREIEQLNVRYNHALQNEQTSFRYSLRLRLATYEGVRSKILQFARMKANRMDDIEEEILNCRAV